MASLGGSREGQPCHSDDGGNGVFDHGTFFGVEPADVRVNGMEGAI
jgi:hypothetical protein